MSQKIVKNSDNKDDEEVIRLLRPAKKILNKVWRIAERQETCLSFHEMMFLYMAKKYVHSICIREWKGGIIKLLRRYSGPASGLIRICNNMEKTYRKARQKLGPNATFKQIVEVMDEIYDKSKKK